MKLLDAVNLILPKLGEHAVTRLDLKHPTLALVLPEVENELVTTLLDGWWFNEFENTLYPDFEGKITLGTDILKFLPNDGQYCATRGQALYNPDTLSYVWTAPIKGIVTQRVLFDELPETAGQYIFYSALVSVYITDLGITQDVQAWQAKAGAAHTRMLAEHVRQRKYSTRQSSRFQRITAALRG